MPLKKETKLSSFSAVSLTDRALLFGKYGMIDTFVTVSVANEVDTSIAVFIFYWHVVLEAVWVRLYVSVWNDWLVNVLGFMACQHLSVI